MPRFWAAVVLTIIFVHVRQRLRTVDLRLAVADKFKLQTVEYQNVHRPRLHDRKSAGLRLNTTRSCPTSPQAAFRR